MRNSVRLLSLRASLGAAALAAGAATPALAQTPAPQVPVQQSAAPVTVLDAINITATRSERPLAEVPASVTVIDSETIDRTGAGTMRDVVRYEPGILVGNQPTRTGQTSFSIRGIGENRVRIQIDGVKVPDFPGSNLGAGTYTRDFVDLDAIKRMEIVKGAASALYGSDAIGGVVSYITKDPKDYLDKVGKDWYVGAKAGYSSADRTFSETLTSATRVGNFEALLLYTRRDGEEARPKGFSGANPQDTAGNNVLGKLVWNATPVDHFRLTTEFFNRRTDTNVLSDLSSTVTGSFGRDETNRQRISIDHSHEAPFLFFDRAQWRVYYSGVDRTEDSTQRRGTGAAQALRLTNLKYDQDIWGGEVQFGSTLHSWGVEHALTYGGSLDYSKTSRPRDRKETNLATGVVTKSFSGGPGVPSETFPNKNFPDTTTLQGGAYLQDEIKTGRLTLLPGIRIDYYRFNPEPDAAFLTSNSQNFKPRQFSDVAVSPKFGTTFQITQQYSAFGQYGHGFRAPPYDDANIGFTNGPQRYEILPNPDLRPETSDGGELGLRGRFGDGSSVQLSGFYNSYKDFIDSQVVGTRSGITQFQSRNLPDAVIFGAEAKGEWRFRPAWSLLGAAAYARGEDKSTKRPIDSVAPFTVVAGLKYDDLSGNWGAQLTGTQVARHSRVNDPANYKTPSYSLVDLTAYYQVTSNFSINAGIFNLLDQKYFVFRDVAGLLPNRSDLGRYAQPGRSFMVNASIYW